MIYCLKNFISFYHDNLSAQIAGAFCYLKYGAVSVNFSDDTVCRQNQYKTDHRLVQPCCRRHPQSTHTLDSPVNISINRVRYIHQSAAVHGYLIKQAKIRPEDTAQLEQGHRNDSGTDYRNGNVHNPLESCGAVYSCRFIIAGINADN